jgi:hypothetical protein
VLKRADDPRRFGAPTYPSLSAAVAAAPAHGTRPFRILVTRGLWDEQVVIDKPFVHLIGEDRQGSMISHSGGVGPDRAGRQALGHLPHADPVRARAGLSAPQPDDPERLRRPGRDEQAGRPALA